MSALSNGRRIILGIMLAPLIPGLLMLALSLLGNPGEGIWALKLTAMFAYPSIIGLGLPLHFLFQRNGWTSAWPYLIAGTIAGVAIAYFVFPSLHVPGSGPANASSIAIAAICAFFGAVTATTFWSIARPNKSFSS